MKIHVDDYMNIYMNIHFYIHTIGDCLPFMCVKYILSIRPVYQHSVNFHLVRLVAFSLLSQPKLNHNSTQPNITKVAFDTKMTLHHHH